jgi:hypothetical protein
MVIHTSVLLDVRARLCERASMIYAVAAVAIVNVLAVLVVIRLGGRLAEVRDDFAPSRARRGRSANVRLPLDDLQRKRLGLRG